MALEDAFPVKAAVYGAAVGLAAAGAAVVLAEALLRRLERLYH